ncbi:MAG: SpvB/TcaC N-terminal domain-containing protein [Candidatus Amoebophilus sp.]
MLLSDYNLTLPHYNMQSQLGQSQIKTSKLSLPKGGGAIRGIGETFQANEFSGTTNLSIPIFASACRDFTPQLQLAYSSGTGNGPWGLGFSLSIPQITRQTRKGTPLYQDTDTFILSGTADLVPLDQAPRTAVLQGTTYTIQTFGPRQEGLFSLIEYWQPTDPSQAFWKVTSKNHTISIFGKTDQAKIVDPNNPSHIFTWLLEESYNTTGDHQMFLYKQENTENVPAVTYEQGHVTNANRYIERIQYGNEKPLADSILLNPQANPGSWHFEIVFDYGEYVIDPSNTDPYQPVNKWACRPDPFSSYEAGFEIRTYRRCAHTLMFHRFTQELGDKPVLVQATAYDYQTNTAQLSECNSITETGYSYDTTQQVYTTASLPPLSLTYTPFQPQGHAFALLTDEQKQGLPGLNEPPNYTLVDLYGEGIPGILYNEETSTYYRTPYPLNGTTISNKIGPQPLNGKTRNVDVEQAMQYGSWQVLNSFPSQRAINDQGVLLQDLTGSGQLDVVLTSSNIQGYWEAKSDHTWKPFRSLPAWPANFPAPEQTWVDVTGDGIDDLVQLTAKQVLVYPNARTRGLAQPLIQPKAPDMPPSLASSPVEVVRFADMAGSGQSHLVRIRNGEVVYWPNLSYGRFGAPITMARAPNFGKEFNATQLFLADLDGSGTTDLIYLEPHQALIYLNQSGNSFSDAIILPLPVTFDSLDQITFADIYGRGNECLVISEPHAMPAPRYWCYDFCQGQKPYLLYRMDNNLGANTEITYGSSVDFYLTDKQAGLPWITPLPFPVQVITQITHTDAISGSRYISQYAYHHGYYDGVEREFRGFGRVDRQDAEYFPTDPSNPQQNPNYVAPSLSRTWYHTGAYVESATLSRQYAKEYYAGDSQAFDFPDSTFDWNGIMPDGATIRQAYVAMAGTVLRTEVYGLDDTPESANPYSVSENNFLVQLRQPKETNLYAIFYVHGQQSLTYTYECNPQDPQIHQSCVLQVDAYGNVERSCAIAYPRRNVEEALPAQQQLKVTCGTQSYVNQTSPEIYLIGIPIESQSYEITTFTPTPGAMFSFVTLQQRIVDALATLSPTVPSSEQAKLLGWEQFYYVQVNEQDKKNTLLSLGQVALPLLLGEHHIAEFSQAQVAAALQGALEGEALKQKLEEGYYQLDTTSNYWWDTGLTAQYFGLEKFYFSSATVDPVGNQTQYSYDEPHYLLLNQVTDALQNTVKSQAIDYQHLHPMQLIDANGNTSEVKLDPLGRVVYTSHYGHEAGQAKGFVPLSQAPTVIPSTLQDVIDDPAQYLGNTQSYFYYNVFAWQKQQSPVVGLALVAEQYPGAMPTRIQIHLSYTDGFGRTLCSKSKVEAGESFLYDPITHQVTEGTTQDRWLTSGRVVYNNKGKLIQQYEPYYINTPAYVSNPVVDTFGVTPTLYYDPLYRLIQTLTAKGFLVRKTWTAWEEALSDANDTLKDSPYYQDNILTPNPNSRFYDPKLTPAGKQNLAYVVQYFANTPRTTLIDNLGNAIITQRINKSLNNPSGEVLQNYYTYDILGRELTSADPRLSAAGKYNFISTYSLTGAVLQVVSADAGTRWGLNNTLGNLLWCYDARQITITPSYDVLHRPTQVHVYKPASEKDSLDQIVERFVYGDTLGPGTKPEDNNLKGQVYQHYDQAGLITIPSYSLLGAPLRSQRQLRLDYKQEANWSGNATDHLNSLLQSIVYQTQTSYDALGRVTEALDIDNNQTVPTYHLSGLLDQITITTQNDGQTKQVVQNITYNAKGQRQCISYGNATTSTYTYDPKTYALIQLQTINNHGKTLQDLLYVYDPVGNVVEKTDQGQNTVYYKNQEINPTATYTYDSLYRLIQGTGREKIGNSAAKSGREIPLIPTAPHANDNDALQNYIEQYSYDTASNLIQTQHIAQQDSWTRQMVVSNTSNRAVLSTINGSDGKIPTPDQVDQYFDVHGNQIRTSQLEPLAWDYRDNLQQAITVKHADGTYDGEYYVYDGSGQRIRKISEQYGQGGSSITFKETLYLGSIEYRRTLQGVELATATVQTEYHSLRILDDQQCVATQDRWVVGEPPSGFQNPSWRYHLEDYLGSCTVEVDEQGQQISYEEYTPFGSSLLFIGTGSASQLKQYRYAGQERDSVTGFYYYGARYYAPWLARWLSPDPAGTINGLNLYAFVTDDPETFRDVGGMGKGDNKKAKEKKNVIQIQRRNTRKRGEKMSNEHFQAMVQLGNEQAKAKGGGGLGIVGGYNYSTVSSFIVRTPSSIVGGGGEAILNMSTQIRSEKKKAKESSEYNKEDFNSQAGTKASTVNSQISFLRRTESQIGLYSLQTANDIVAIWNKVTVKKGIRTGTVQSMDYNSLLPTLDEKFKDQKGKLSEAIISITEGQTQAGMDIITDIEKSTGIVQELYYFISIQLAEKAREKKARNEAIENKDVSVVHEALEALKTHSFSDIYSPASLHTQAFIGRGEGGAKAIRQHYGLDK